MATVQDTLVTRFTLKDDFSKGTEKITAQLRSFLGVITKAAAATGGVMLAAGAAAVKTAADLDALKMGLVAVAGSTQAANAQFERLKEVAKLPGLGLTEAIQASIALQSAGYEATLAERAIMGFGNALATVGKGREELTGVMMALGQISSKGKVQAEEIMQIAERVPQIRKVMQAAFGTADTEELQKMGLSATAFVSGVVAELEKLPKVAGGAKNEFSNLADAFSQFMASVGTPLLKPVVAAIQTMTESLTRLSDSGALTRIGEGLAGMFNSNWIQSTLVKALSWTVATLTNLPTIMQNVSSSMVNAFEQMRKSAAAFAAVVGALFFTGKFVTYIGMVIKAYNTLKAAIASATVAQTVMEALMTGGASLAKLAVGAAAAAAAAVGVYKLLEKVAPDVTALVGESIGFDKIASDAADIQKLLTATDPTATGTTPPVQQLEDATAPQMTQQTNYLREIAGNTRDQLQLDQRILGGGTVGANAMSPVKLKQALSGTQSGGGNVERQVWALVQAIRKEMFGANELAVGRLGNSPVRF